MRGMSLDAFHPIVRTWFERRFGGPTDAQALGWPAIASGRHTLIAAPTGSGKTLAAFLTSLDMLVKQALREAPPLAPPGVASPSPSPLVGRGEQAAGLADETQVVYVSPLKALANDIQRNLLAPLEEIRAIAEEMGQPLPEIRVAVRTGDTPQKERTLHARRPPHVFITTPESLYILLTSERGRHALRTTRTLILDELHAVAPSKRGSHLALSVERLCHLAEGPVTRIGLSATQKPIEEMARLLTGGQGGASLSFRAESRDLSGNTPYSRTLSPRDVSAALNMTSHTPSRRGREVPASAGTTGKGPGVTERGAGTTGPPPPPLRGDLSPLGRGGSAECEIVDTGHRRAMDVAIELPRNFELGPIATHEQWAQTLDQVVELAEQHRTTLVFVNTRRLVERVAHLLSDRLGDENVAAHHGSLSRETRYDTEQRLKEGRVRVCVASASLELGIDIGDIDLVCQIGSPRNIGVALQRVGRSGHFLGGTPKGRFFPLTRDELVETVALLRCIKDGALDALHIPPWPLDVLAQQVVASCVMEEWDEDALYDLLTQAYPYRELSREHFDEVVRMLSEGVAGGGGGPAGDPHPGGGGARRRTCTATA